MESVTGIFLMVILNHSIFFQNEMIFLQLHKLDKLDRITQG